MNRLPLSCLVFTFVVSVAVGADGDKPIGVGATPNNGAADRRWAVVIGVSDYQKVPKLRYCVADARLLHETLAKRAGFSRDRMLLLTDDARRCSEIPNRSNILRHMADFLGMARTADAVLVFLIAHTERVAVDGFG